MDVNLGKVCKKRGLFPLIYVPYFLKQKPPLSKRQSLLDVKLIASYRKQKLGLKLMLSHTHSIIVNHVYTCN